MKQKQPHKWSFAKTFTSPYFFISPDFSFNDHSIRDKIFAEPCDVCWQLLHLPSHICLGLLLNTSGWNQFRNLLSVSFPKMFLLLLIIVLDRFVFGSRWCNFANTGKYLSIVIFCIFLCLFASEHDSLLCQRPVHNAKTVLLISTLGIFVANQVLWVYHRKLLLSQVGSTFTRLTSLLTIQLDLIKPQSAVLLVERQFISDTGSKPRISQDTSLAKFHKEWQKNVLSKQEILCPALVIFLSRRVHFFCSLPAEAFIALWL